MILAGDIGGTNARIALFARDELREPVRLEIFRSREFASFEALIEQFLVADRTRVEAASFGIAGPVKDGRSNVTNVDWELDGARLATVLGLPSVGLLNDLEATAVGLEALRPDDLVTLNEGYPDPTGNRAVIAAGTGLGQAGIVRVGDSLVPFATEAGHACFAPASSEQSDLLTFLREDLQHQVSVELVCSGMGILNIFRWCLHESQRSEPAWFTRELEEGDPAAAVTRAAAEAIDEDAVRTVGVFVDIYGSEAGNLALRMLATGGVYVAGGIAGKLKDALADGRFLAAFLDKSRLVELLRKTPVHLVLNDQTALLGAALHA
ncbi:MAG: glucokinase, partial [Gaiellaceae bacterium]